MMAPLEGLRVVEVSIGLSAVGAGLAGSLPGSLLRDLGADVTRVRSAHRPALDAGVEFARVWDRGKEIVEIGGADSGTDPARGAETIGALARDADVLFLAGPEEEIERRGLRYQELARANPRLVVVRVRPSRNALGAIPDLELLVHARSGLLTQIRGHRPGPVFGDLAVAAAGAGLSAAVGALARLYEREATGRGGWAETSLYEGLQAVLPMIIGKVEHHSATTTLLWKNQGPAEALAYRCADGGYVQLWFGAKGAYEAFLEHMGDPPSERGYNADMMSGALVERGERWAKRFATRDRDWWVKDLSGHKFRCEPVWRPGEALRDPHLREVGLSEDHQDPERGAMTVLGPAVRVTPAGGGGPRRAASAASLLSDVRVLDLSAYLAGPVTPLVLAELGADVLKVEPTGGDAHRAMEPMFAAGQRGKRAMALDLKSPEAPAVLERLFRWADVVHHNSRVGLAERLGYDEAAVRAANPEAVYSFASGFGDRGPRALLPANDQLMQALAGIEAGQGGAGRPPTYLVWGAVDVTGGWIAACGVLAGLYARRRHGGGQAVSSSLLGAALTLKSGAFLAGEEVVEGPVLDADQTGYGAAYRIYQGRDQKWFALAVPDTTAWDRLRDVVRIDGLPAAPPPLRTDRDGRRQPAEALLEEAFRTKDAAAWVTELRHAGVPVEPVVEADRTEFAAGFVDDPVNRVLGRVAVHEWGDRGRVEQPCFPPHLGPAPRPPVPATIPRLGEHTMSALQELGFDDGERAALAESGAVRGEPPT
ncbi:CoA transferase [Actinomadura sp. LD22]|uniref:CoA transferase n=1 Tax=Actinomadura physcomitrii TaxID=2650748 RepID=A0A6I4MF89_9ACTN|nr:CoA transferase [Actinomadura physcomitrii]MWA03540.1 CoA transferase [Actinomadura physcomitrii]